MKSFKVRIDWTVQAHYPDEPVDVELHVMDEEPWVIHQAADPPTAAGWVRRWFEGRGLGFTCDIDRHQREGHTHLVVHPCPRRGDSPARGG